jgi:RimJ/RimL family protein N-acetyltransferase
MRTARLTLRRFDADDVELLVPLNADPEVMRYLGNGRPMARAAVLDTELPRVLADHGDLGFWAAFANGGFIGWFSAVPSPDGAVEIGYRLARSAWGHGYATEGAQLMVAVALRSGAQRVVATTMAVNAASRHVLEKAGLRYVRTWFGEWDEPIAGAEQGEVDYVLEADQDGS